MSLTFTKLPSGTGHAAIAGIDIYNGLPRRLR
jgi:hypothetical protein